MHKLLPGEVVFTGKSLQDSVLFRCKSTLGYNGSWEASSNAATLPKHCKLREAFCQQQTQAVGQSFTICRLVLPGTDTILTKVGVPRGHRHSTMTEQKAQQGVEGEGGIPESKGV